MFLLLYEQKDSSNTPVDTLFLNFSNALSSRLQDGGLLKYYSEKIKGCEALAGNITGIAGETKVYYRAAVIKNGTCFYKIILGISDDYRSDYDEDMNQIIRSFSIDS